MAVDWHDAMHLTRAREQHSLAFRLGVLRTEHKSSVEDMTVASSGWGVGGVSSIP
jgi:hypothetical protein